MAGKKSTIRQIQKYNNAYRINVPIDIIEQAAIKNGEYVVFSVKKNKIIISPVKITEE